MKKPLTLVIAFFALWQLVSAAVITVNQEQLKGHTGHKFNPHSTTALQVGARDKSGMDSRTDNFISYSTSGTFRVRPSSSTFTVWEAGKKYTLAGQQVAVPKTSGLHFVYFSGGTLQTSTNAWDIAGAIAPVATVYYSGTAGTLSDERHSADRDRLLHKMLHNSVGARFASGLIGTFATGSFSIGEGVVYDEDLPHIVPISTAARVWYRSGSIMTFVNGITTPYYAPGGALKYDNAGTLASANNARFVCNYVYATNDTDYPISIVVGQAQHTTAALARAESQPSFPNLPTREWKLIYRVIAQTGPSFIEATDYRESSSLPGGGTSALPASSITFTPWTASRLWSNVQTAITETNRLMPVACGTDPATAIFDGAPGIQGERGYRGYSGARGERGYRGYSGARGERGYRGYSGAAATVAIGTVTTVSTVTPASVTNSGTLSAAILNFEIPKGADGDPGAITQAQILDKIDDPSTGTLARRTNSADTDVMIKIMDLAGNTRLFVTASGMLVIQDANGVQRWAYSTTSHAMTMKSSSGRAIFSMSSSGMVL